MKKKKIWLSSPHMGKSEQLYVNEAFETNWVAPVGPHIDQFEKELGKYTSMRYVAALSSGTAAIHLGLKLLGVKNDDYVICQSFTFAGSANPINYLNANPVFVDSEMTTWNMDPTLLEEAINSVPKKPKCIIPVHLYGMPAQMNEIMNIANRYDIPILEDAAEALGSFYHEKACGSFGDLSVFSFNGNKIITTSGGGALLGNNESLITKAKFLSTQAKDPVPHYQHSEIGYNYRISNISASIGIGQMEVLEDRVEKRRKNFFKYEGFFRKVNQRGFEVGFQPQEPESISNRWLTCIIIDPDKNGGISSEFVRSNLEKEDIESRPLWKPMHLQPIFKDSKCIINGNSEALFRNGLCLPSGSNLSDEDFERIFYVMDEIFK